MKILFAILPLAFFTSIAVGQDVSARLDEAVNEYQSENLESTRFALQQSLTELNVLVGQEILKILPEELAGNPYLEDADAVMGNAAGITGVFVNRSYPGETKSVYVELVTDSPLLATLSGFLTNPLFMNAAGGNQKVVKIDNYKAMLQRDEEDPQHYELQLPLDQSLFTIRYDGFDSENEVTAIANQIGVREIASLLK